MTLEHVRAGQVTEVTSQSSRFPLEVPERPVLEILCGL